MASEQSTRQSIYDFTDPSILQRVVLSLLLAACVALAWWILFGQGLASLGRLAHQRWPAGDFVRRVVLIVALTTYFIRVLFTQFVFLKRGLGWTEVFTIFPWVLCIYLVLGIAGGANSNPLGAIGAIGILFFILGSWMNSWAEFQRHIWKGDPSNHGKLYTMGLFRLSRHPNYLGDMISFTGLCLIAGRFITAFIPALMLSGFVFVNIPMLDAHLQSRYGAQFDEYAKKTRKLIPFLY